MINKLRKLEQKRKLYKNLEWETKSGIKTKIVDMEDSHILNCLKNVAQSLALSERFPLIEEFKHYNKVPYQMYADAFYNEYLYRQELVEERYREYLNLEILEQEARDKAYYDNKYEYPVEF